MRGESRNAIFDSPEYSIAKAWIGERSDKRDETQAKLDER